MKLFNKSMLIACLISFAAQADIVNRKQARNYIEHVIATLFNPNDHAGKYADQLDQWTEDVTHELLNAHSRSYSTDKIYSTILDRSLDLIEQQASNYAHKELSKAGLYHKSYLADNIADDIVSEANSIINGSSTLKTGALSNFIGAPLKSKIQKMIEKQSRDNHKKDRVKREYVYEVETEYVPAYRPIRVIAPAPVVPVYPVYQPICAPVAPRFGFGFQVRFA